MRGTGNPAVLDGEYGFPKFYGASHWEPAKVVSGLGETWAILKAQYKPYACCRVLHSQIDCMTRIISKHGLSPESIESVTSLSMPFVANADQWSVHTQQDAQFSIPYVLSLAAHGIPVDADCQNWEIIEQPSVRQFMAKIRCGVHPDAIASRREGRGPWVARVEVVANGQHYIEETSHAKGGFAFTDDELSDKFERNACTLLPLSSVREAREMIWHLDEVTNIAQVVDHLALQ